MSSSALVNYFELLTPPLPHLRRNKNPYITHQHEAVSLLRSLSANPTTADLFLGKGPSPQMLPLEAIWKWLWQNFTPSEVKSETISRDGLVEEVLSLPESAKTPKNAKQIHNLIVTFIYRYLQTLFPNQSVGYAGEKRQLFYLRRATAAEKAERLKAIPTFPEDLRLKLAKELREEMLGRRSATNLLSLGGPSTGNVDNPATAPALRAGIQTDTRLPELLQRSRSAAAAAAALGVPPAADASLAAEVAKNTSSNILKRSGTESDFANAGDARKKQRRKEGEEGDAAEEAEPEATSVMDGVVNEGATELITPLSPTPSGGAITSASMNIASGNLQAEVGMLRARQLAMQREIHDLRTELQRRDRTMHRELSALRMEMDALRAEMPHKQAKVGVLQVPQLSPSAIKVPVPVAAKTAPASAQAATNTTAGSASASAPVASPSTPELKRPDTGNGTTPKAT